MLSRVQLFHSPVDWSPPGSSAHGAGFGYNLCQESLGPDTTEVTTAVTITEPLVSVPSQRGRAQAGPQTSRASGWLAGWAPPARGPAPCRHLSTAEADSGPPCEWTSFPDRARGRHGPALLRGCHDLTSTGVQGSPSEDTRAMERPGESDCPFLGAMWARSHSPARQAALSAQLPWGCRDHSPRKAYLLSAPLEPARAWACSGIPGHWAPDLDLFLGLVSEGKAKPQAEMSGSG